MKYNFIFLLSIFCLNLGAQDLSSTMTVSPGTSVSITSGTELTAYELNLKSTSDSFACVMLDGTITDGTLVNYDRYVNVVGTPGVNGGNDLVSLPVKTDAATFNNFSLYNTDGTISTANYNYMPRSGDLYAFGPYSNVTDSYINYDGIVDASLSLQRAVGYRAATKLNGQTLRFSGTISKNTETVTITTIDPIITPDTTGDPKNWNSVGNPYPTYLNSTLFLDENLAVLAEDAAGIYGYNSGTQSGTGTVGNFTIINRLVNIGLNITPGQGFLVANDFTAASNVISFTPAMRVFSGSDDFILGRSDNVNEMVRLKAEHAGGDFATEIYFNENSTQGVDRGYDAKLFGEASLSFSLYSELLEDSEGNGMAIQSLGSTDLSSVRIPLGLKASQGQQITFSIETSTLPTSAEVYLEDNVENTYTLLNQGDYTFTADTAISGTGRFYLNIGDATLSLIDNDVTTLNLYAANHKIFVKGELLATTQVNVYDTLGRVVMSSNILVGSDSNEIDASQLTTGIYIVKLNNVVQELTKKVILK
ncbi:T9SS type A sorting domain-containing protein [Winogradskyella wichelsiae]|uniref:T9SS type A sorting domain-containing protein n=1 Tax=Winogradskyella wichelsiae TaxID=2697007 RepID=UPI0015C7E7D8|nr:T9SS type A sorting domain-containing protein [Winogradskyella wichelsiae]